MGDAALDVACLLLNRFCAAIHHDQDDDHSEELARTGAEPGRAAGLCPSGGPPSPRFSAIEAAGLHFGPQPSSEGKRPWQW